MSSQHMGSNMEDGGNQDDDGINLAGRRSVKSDRSRCCWSVREEEILIAIMKKLTTAGWKSDNGFRAGYLVRCREVIKREFSKTDICVQPHIYSKVSTWKKNYSSLLNIINRSGVGFNSDGDYKIECDDEQWSQIGQV